LTSALVRNGFHGPTSYYLNHENNARNAAAALNDAKLAMSVLFICAEYDQIADVHVPPTEMRKTSADLTEAMVAAGHWLQMERPNEVNLLMAEWLQRKGLACSR
jgi:soluble epoxide hydrolase / lipid-phosphate phosphatase